MVSMEEAAIMSRKKNKKKKSSLNPPKAIIKWIINLNRGLKTIRYMMLSIMMMT
jgi:hypothetical protein